jgi:hypothetical protein
MKTNIEEQIAFARKKLDDVSGELKALEQRAKEEQEGPWEPPGGDWVIAIARNEIIPARMFIFPAKGFPFSYPTRESAEAALPYLRFFTRLVRLAADLNPSGKPGGEWRVSVTYGGKNWSYGWVWGGRAPWDLFETKEAAEKAAHIMNRDGWEVPAL